MQIKLFGVYTASDVLYALSEWVSVIHHHFERYFGDWYQTQYCCTDVCETGETNEREYGGEGPGNKNKGKLELKLADPDNAKGRNPAR